MARRGKSNRTKKRKGLRGHPRSASVRRQLDIRQLGRHGDGISDLEGAQVFVPYTLPGEKVLADIDGDRGKLVQVIEPSSERVAPDCPHFGRCGGCVLQHASDDLVSRWKHDIVAAAFRARDIAADIAPLIDGHGDGRRRVTVHVRRNGAQVHAGFMAMRSHTLEPIDTCPILGPALHGVFDLALKLVKPLCRFGSSFDLAFTATQNGLSVAVAGRGLEEAGDDLEARQALAVLAETEDFARLSLDGDIVAARHPSSVQIGKAQVELPLSPFLQATAKGEDILAALVRDGVGPARRIADLFAGVGPITIRLARQAIIHAVDSDGAALNALANAAARSISGTVTTETRDLFRRPLLGDELNPYDAVILDPPRAGAQAQAYALAASNVANVISVSCDPATFARDAAILLAGGYHMGKVTPIDQFKWSPHVEVVAVFRR